MSLWELPQSAVFGNKEYSFKSDYRAVLTIISKLCDPDLPELIRWHIAINEFYETEIPFEYQQEAMQHLVSFLSYGEEERKPGPQLLDWEQDVRAIVADVNKVAGAEIRSVPYLHWWTFLSYFHAIGEGQLSTIISIRDKLRRGKKLEDWEKEFYRDNKARVDLKKKYSPEELAEQQRLIAVLGE